MATRKAARLGDLCLGHPEIPCIPRPSITASTNVFVNSKGWHRKDDLWASHCSPPHLGAKLVSGSPNVFVNNKDAGRAPGDPISCLTVTNTGSPDVFIN